MNIYMYILLLVDNIKEDEVVRMGRWLVVIWGVNLYFISIVSFGCATPSGATEICKLKKICNGLLKP